MLNKLEHYWSRAQGRPPSEVLKRALGVARRVGRNGLQARLDAVRPSFGAAMPTALGHGYVAMPPLPALQARTAQVLALAAHARAHRFDLLGSGWVEVRHGMACPGLAGHRYPPQPAVRADADGRWLAGRLNRANVAEAQQIWRLVTPGYTPIDWQLDFKSGYRWFEQTWYRHVPYAHAPGVDVKVPWELARMQHLPQLAWAFALASAGTPGFEPADVYAAEFRDQVLDFIATNPPRFGVNWSCAMDVGIRVANWLLAYDLLQAAGWKADPAFQAVFARSVHAHGHFLVHNLEWSAALRSNHYLADVAGLLFAAAYLPGAADTDAWLALAVHELVAEVETQFGPDGGNFEASTYYHRLSMEMVAYGTALVLGLPEARHAALQHFDPAVLRLPFAAPRPPITLFDAPARPTPFPPTYQERLERMADFVVHLTKPTGAMPQIGDNDSGRFFKLDPCFTLQDAAAWSRFESLNPEAAPGGGWWLEDQGDPRGVVAAAFGLVQRPDWASFVGDRTIEPAIIRSLAGGRAFAPRHPAVTATAQAPGVAFDALHARLSQLGPRQRQRRHIALPASATGDPVATYAYPDFGVYVWRSAGLYLAVRCGAIGQNGHGGHAHLDQLAIELCVEGEDWIADPGTFLYTPSPAHRNAYRSVRAHFAPWLPDAEPGRLELGLFELGGNPAGQCLVFGEGCFAGVHHGYGTAVHRLIRLDETGLVIEDFCEAPLAWPASPAPELVNGRWHPPLPFSTGYGWRLAAPATERAGE